MCFFFLFIVTVQRRGIFWFDIWMGRKRFCVGRYQLRWIWTDRRIWAGFGWIEGQAAALVIVLTPATNHHHYHQDSSSAQCSNVYPPSLIVQMDYIVSDPTNIEPHSDTIGRIAKKEKSTRNSAIKVKTHLHIFTFIFILITNISIIYEGILHACN